ncbi:hypothetical protein MKX03_012007 [Papaver bracteatum]|nr:hypothetical protein MKX03_012007 [Papaver bracteatum]
MYMVQMASWKPIYRYVYVWHAITGYWGGVRPGATGMEHYESKLTYPAISSPGVQSNEPCDAFNSIAKNCLGLVNPEKILNFYNEVHPYLASAGIDGVKVDVQNILETLGAGHGGRVELSRRYHQTLEASISRNFRDNGVIACMGYNTDGFYRSSITHNSHCISCLQHNFLGEFMQPDWDMLRSLHPMAEYHGAALAGQTSRNCLFSDPARDGKSICATKDSPNLWLIYSCPLLQYLDLTDFSGVMGVFNCQGAGWRDVDKKNLIHDELPRTITGVISAKNVAYIPKIAEEGWNDDTGIYSHLGGEVVYLPRNTSLPITLKTREYEVFTVAPVKGLSNQASFAPVGLIEMFNSGGAIKELKHESEKSGIVNMKVCQHWQDKLL